MKNDKKGSDEDEVIDPCFMFIATPKELEFDFHLDPKSSKAQIKNFVDMLEIIMFNNDFVHQQVTETIASTPHPLRDLILSMLPRKIGREYPAISPLNCWGK